MGGRRSWLAAAGVAVAAIAAGSTVWVFVLRETAAPASLDDALARYRAEAAAGRTPIPPGVYVYATTGSESVSALGGRTHRYPKRSTLTVTAGGCGMRLRWDVLQHRSNVYEICDGAGRLAAWTETHRFVGRDDVTVWRCQGTAWLPRNRSAGVSSPHRCRGGKTVQHGTLTVVGEERLMVAAGKVEVVHLELVAAESEEARGSLTEDRWLERDTGLPVRVRYRVRTHNPSPIGDVVFEERFTISLTSLVPRR